MRPAASPAASSASRSFVALRVGPAAAAPLERLARALAREDDALRLAPLEDLHLTLAFLGPTPTERVPALGAALALVAGRHAPLAVRYVGLGAFPGSARARVLWVGVRDEPPGALARLAADVQAALGALGFPREERAFHGHVTLARVRDGRRVARATAQQLERRAGEDFGGERLSDLKLIVSLAGSGGYTYKDLTSHPLGSPA